MSSSRLAYKYGNVGVNGATLDFSTLSKSRPHFMIAEIYNSACIAVLHLDSSGAMYIPYRAQGGSAIDITRGTTAGSVIITNSSSSGGHWMVTL